MLQQVMPEQIPSYWEAIKKVIETALPKIAGESNNKANNILERLLEGVFTCWVSYGIKDGEKKANGVGLTRIISDEITETKSLLIYCMATIEGGDPDFKEYQEGILALRKYARSKGCSRITSYTDIEYLVDMARNLGGGTIYSFIAFPV